METVIREGALRLLLLNDASCDVILSCQGHRLMAHKLILSMASSVFRALLLEGSTDSTVIIFPDTTANVMSMMLDYIYTGSVIVYSNMLKDFLGLADLLKICIDVDYNGVLLKKSEVQEDDTKLEKKEIVVDISSDSEEIRSRTTRRKMPNLLPLTKLRHEDKKKTRKKMFSYVLPSPWCPRLGRIIGNPQTGNPENQISPNSDICRLPQNDTNNNNQFQPKHSSDKSNRDLHITYPFQTRLKELSRIEKSTLPTTEDPFQLRLSLFENNPIANNLSKKDINSNEFLPDNTIKYPLISQLEFSKCLNLRRIHKPSETPKNFTSSFLNSYNEISRESLEYSSPELSKSSLGKLFGSHPDSPTSKEEFAKLNILNDATKDSSNHSFSNESDGKGGENELKVFDKNKPFMCEDCGKGFSQMRNYKYHRSIHEGTKEFATKCPECGKTFNDKGYLSSHLKIHRDKKEYACPQCPKRFNQRVAYNMHLRIHTGVKPHECLVCGKSFSRKMLLKQHQRVHTGERPYACPECGKTFADRSNMSLHARLHTGVKPYACNLCPKSFTKKHHLKTHMNFHTGLKPYTCQKCGLAFSQSSNMRTHYKKCMAKETNENTTEDGIDKKDDT